MTRNLILLSCLIAAVSLCYSCKGGARHGHDHEESEQAAHHDEDGDKEHGHHAEDILLEPEKAKAAGVVVETVERGTFHDVIVTSGKVLAATCDETNIVATASGIVSHSRHLSEGMEIKGGTTLYTINSAGLQEGDPSRHALLAYQAAKREYDRALPLVEDHIISERDFNAIKAEYESTRQRYEYASRNHGSSGVSISAPSTGFVKACAVKDGDYVEVGTLLMTITKNQHLYLRAEVPVRHYAALDKVRSAKFRTQYSDGVFDLKDMHGELMSSGKSAMSTSSYVPVTFQFDNRGNIVPGAYAEVFLITGERSDVISLPATALTEEQGIYYVYIQEDAHSYHKQEVTLGATDGERTEITSGLKGGERVVTKGAINVRLAAATTIPEHSHSH